MITQAKNTYLSQPKKGQGARAMLMTVAALLDKTRLILVLIFLVALSSLQLVDPDYFRHLKTGEYIVSNNRLPSGDIFSYTRFGQHWVLHEWLFEVLLYSVFSLGGEVGVKLMTAIFLMCTLSLLLVITQRISRSAAAAMGVTMMALIPLLGGIAPRPQLVTYAFFTIFLFGLLSFKYCQTKISWFLMPLLMIVWVNAHGGFVIGIALVGLFTGCEWLVYWINGVDAPAQRQRLARLTKIASVTVLASLVNPGFLTHWLYPFQVLGMAANHVIQEWQSPNFHDFGPQCYLLLVLVFFASYACADQRPDATELLLPGFFIVAGFVSMRHMPLAALSLTPFTARYLSGAIAAVFSAWQGSGLGRRYRKWSGARQLGGSEFILNWLVLLVVLAALVGFAPVFQAREQLQANKRLPIGATNYVLAHSITGNMFNDYGDGGYLIYRFAPTRRIFIDGRADLYGDQFVFDFLDIYQGKANWKEKFDRLSIDYAIVGNDAPIRQLLKADPAFREVFVGLNHSVVVRSVGRESSAH